MEDISFQRIRELAGLSPSSGTSKKTQILVESDDDPYSRVREELLEDDVEDETKDKREEDDDEDIDELEEAFLRIMEAEEKEDCDDDEKDSNKKDEDCDDEEEDIKESYEQVLSPEKRAVHDVLHSLQTAMKRIDSFTENSEMQQHHQELNSIKHGIADIISQVTNYSISNLDAEDGSGFPEDTDPTSPFAESNIAPSQPSSKRRTKINKRPFYTDTSLPSGLGIGPGPV